VASEACSLNCLRLVATLEPLARYRSGRG